MTSCRKKINFLSFFLDDFIREAQEKIDHLYNMRKGGGKGHVCLSMQTLGLLGSLVAISLSACLVIVCNYLLKKRFTTTKAILT